MTLEKASKEFELARGIKEETLLLHSSVVRNTIDARVIATIILPNGDSYHAEKIIRLTFKREES